MPVCGGGRVGGEDDKVRCGEVDEGLQIVSGSSLCSSDQAKSAGRGGVE